MDTESTPSPTDPTIAGETDNQPPNFDDGDWLLRGLVELAENGVGTGVTLNMGGLLVSGLVISGATYLSELSKTVDAAVGGENAISAFLTTVAPAYDHSKAPPPKRTAYIHLRDVRFYGAGGKVGLTQAPLWRGRLIEVGGFFFGQLSDAS